jgi:hypothetical protein
LQLKRRTLGGDHAKSDATFRPGAIVPDQLTVRVTRDVRNTMLGKALLVAGMGALGGYLYHLDVLADNVKASSLTLLEYTAGFDKYKASLIQPEWPLWGHIALVLFMVGGLVAVYEALGWVLGWLMGRLLLAVPLTGSDRSTLPPPNLPQ